MNDRSVPPQYLGVWKRTLLSTPNARDVATRVFWLQTNRWHAGIRVPADRPDLSSRRGFQDLNRAELLALARQQGFAGITEVDDCICRWHRRIDYQPRSCYNDIGHMRFETPELLFEYGVEQDYFEIWERVRILSTECGALDVHIPPEPRTVVLSAGEWVMLVRDRSEPLWAGESLEALAAELSDAELARALDLEISIGRRIAHDCWRIELSTLPWREGVSVAGLPRR